MPTLLAFLRAGRLQINNRLTLNLGLRYEYSPWMQGYKNQLGTFDGTLAKPLIVASNTNQIDLSSQFSAPTAYALFRNLIQTSTRRASAVDHRSGQESMGAAVWSRLAALWRTQFCAAAMASFTKWKIPMAG